jgi:hypothetical protein
MDVRTHHDSLIVACQQQITAPTDYQERFVELPGHKSGLFNRGKFHVATTLGLNTERIVLPQTIIA